MAFVCHSLLVAADDEIELVYRSPELILTLLAHSMIDTPFYLYLNTHATAHFHL